MKLQKVLVGAALVFASCVALALPVGHRYMDAVHGCETRMSPEMCERYLHASNTVGAIGITFTTLFILILCMIAASPVQRE